MLLFGYLVWGLCYGLLWDIGRMLMLFVLLFGGEGGGID